MNEVILAINVLALFYAAAIVVAIGTVIINLLILRACQKMYTEYFKDRSINKRMGG